MQGELDLAKVMQDLTRFQEEVAKIHGELTSPKQKELLGMALQRMEESRGEVELQFPKAVAAIRTSAERTQARVAAGKEQVEKLKQEFAELAQRTPVEAPQKDEPEFEGELGVRLSAELVERIAEPRPQGTQLPQMKGEIWEDWNWRSEADLT